MQIKRNKSNKIKLLKMTKITVEAIIKSKIGKVWNAWTKPQEITKWCFATDDWEAPFAENDLKVGGKFVTKMSAKDKSFSFDFGGVYTQVILNKLIEYKMEDGREVRISFEEGPQGVKVVETFDAEKENSPEMQKQGWQAIINNFKKYVESKES